MSFTLCLLVILVSAASAQWEPNVVDGRSAMVHLFEWKWTDIAAECERFLGSKGYGGVQVSPPNEYMAITSDGRPWWERYQPVSYRIVSRSGSEAEFTDMVNRCNNVGVRIYVDAVINHMSASWNGLSGVGGSKPNGYNYPDVAYGTNDFHQPPCTVTNYQDANNVRNCELSGLHDLNDGSDYVRGKIVEYMNKLIGIGVAGFRIDAAKHMWPNNLAKIYGALNNLNSNYFGSGKRPFIYQEIIDPGTEAVKKSEYVGMGRVCEFKYGTELANCFNRKNQMKWLYNFGESWGLVSGNNALVFIDNHDNQRGHGGAGEVITFQNSKLYKMANAFMLAWPSVSHESCPATCSVLTRKDPHKTATRTSFRQRSTPMTPALGRGCANTAGGRSTTWLASGTPQELPPRQTGGTMVIIRLPFLEETLASSPLTTRPIPT